MKYYPLRSVEDEVEFFVKVTNGSVPRERARENIVRSRSLAHDRALSIVPEMYKDAEMASLGYVGDDIEETLKQLFSGNVGAYKGMILTGSAGCGKTYAMYAIWKWIAERDPKRCILFENYASFMQKLRSEFADGSAEQQGTVWDIVTCGSENPGVVMIDDLGTSKFSDFEMEKLYMVMDSRTVDYEPTVLSMNLASGEEFSEIFGDRIASRLRYFKRIEFLDQDFRGDNQMQT